MCGIAGIISKKSNREMLPAIDAMLQLMLHRGPDGHGVFHHDNFALGHRRLKILDLRESANQPMFYADEQFHITYNCEVYNYIELKKTLSSLGYSFKTTCDTEVILAAYMHWGADCVNHLNGMWSFCIYDKKNNTLFCSRDHFGIKLFYYIDNDKDFAFVSEGSWLTKHNQQIIDTLHSSPIVSCVADLSESVTNLPKLNSRAKWRLYSMALWGNKFGVEIS